jgi:hypothetical protein
VTLPPRALRPLTRVRPEDQPERRLAGFIASTCEGRSIPVGIRVAASSALVSVRPGHGQAGSSAPAPQSASNPGSEPDREGPSLAQLVVADLWIGGFVDLVELLLAQRRRLRLDEDREVARQDVLGPGCAAPQHAGRARDVVLRGRPTRPSSDPRRPTRLHGRGSETAAPSSCARPVRTRGLCRARP